MRTPMVDYRKLRLSNINNPEYRHLFLLLGWVGYFILYLLTENLIPAESCYPVHCWLDDVVPFCEWFIIPCHIYSAQLSPCVKHIYTKRLSLKKIPSDLCAS